MAKIVNWHVKLSGHPTESPKSESWDMDDFYESGLSMDEIIDAYADLGFSKITMEMDVEDD
jgi:hypothetical protein